MKNQVNRKVSKVLIALLALVVMSVSCLLLTACDDHEHDLKVKTENTATCVAPGQIVYECDCGYTESIATPANAHAYDDGKVVAATCTTNGYTLYTCTVCGSTKMEDIVAATGHDYADPVTQSAATCTQDGVEIKVCKDCDHSVQNIIPKTGHNWGAVQTVNPTCDTDGYTYMVCIDCNTKSEAVYTDELAKLGHTMELVATNAATCTAAGNEVYECVNCDATEYKTIPALGHTLDLAHPVKVVSPTCDVDGYTVYKCLTCDHKELGNEVAATGHAFGDAVIIQNASCTLAGLAIKTCTNEGCTAKQEEVIAATGHTYASESYTEWEPATATAKAYSYRACTVCNEREIGEYADHLCSYELTNVIDEPTCRDFGWGEYSCTHTGCPVSKEASIEKVDHEYVKNGAAKHANCTEQGYQTYSCIHCNDTYLGDATAKLDHKWELTTNDATCTTVKYQVYRCDACGAERGDRLGWNETLSTYDKDSYTEENNHIMVLNNGAQYYSLDGVTVYRDADRTQVVALCNVFAVVDDVNYAFHCTYCQEGIEYYERTYSVLGDNNEVLWYTNHAEDDETYPVRAPKLVERAAIESIEHATHEINDAYTTLALCMLDGLNVYTCPNCVDDWANTVSGMITKDGMFNGTERDLHDYASWEVAPYAGHVIAECSTLNTTVNFIVGETCTAEAEHHYGCVVCNKTLQDLAQTEDIKVRVNAADDAWMTKAPFGVYHGLTDGHDKDMVTVKASDFDGAFPYVTDALGHKFDKYVMVTAYTAKADAEPEQDPATGFAGENVAVASILEADIVADQSALCGLTKLYVAHKCKECLTVKNVAEVDAPEDQKILAHVKYSFNETTGEFTYATKSYDTVTAVVEEDETTTAVNVYVYNAKNGYACVGESFECAYCNATVTGAGHIDVDNNDVKHEHIYDYAETLADCYIAPTCQICDKIENNKHVEPAYRCYSVKGNEQVYCDYCNNHPVFNMDMVTIGATKYPVHANIVVETELNATCTDAGVYKVYCDHGAYGKHELKVGDVIALTKDGDSVVTYGDEEFATMNFEQHVYNRITLESSAVTGYVTLDREEGTTVDFEYVQLTEKMLQIAPNGHRFMATDMSNAPTCTEAGAYGYTCTDCGINLVSPNTADANEADRIQITWSMMYYRDSEFMGIIPGTFTDPVWGTPYTYVTVEDVTRAALGHDIKLDAIEVTANSCINEGYTKYVCSRCDIADLAGNNTITVTAELLAAVAADTTNEKFNATIAAKITTAGEGGTFTYTAADVIPGKLAHDFSIAPKKNAGVVRHDCILGAEIVEFKCTTCTLDIVAAHKAGAYESLDVNANALYYVDALAILEELAKTDTAIVAAHNTELATACEATSFVPSDQHNFNTADGATFDTSSNAGGQFKAPTCSTPGDAYWTCATCAGRQFRPGSVTYDQYVDPTINSDYTGEEELVHDATVYGCGDHCDACTGFGNWDGSHNACSVTIQLVADGVQVGTDYKYANHCDEIEYVSEKFTLTTAAADAIWATATAAGATSLKVGETTIASAAELADYVLDNGATIVLTIVA